MRQKARWVSCVLIVLALLLPAAASRAAGPAADRGLLKLAGRYVKWGNPDYGMPAVVTYAFLDGPRSYPGARNCRAMTGLKSLLARSGIAQDAFEHEVAAAFAIWAGAANLAAHRIGDPERADIVIGAQAEVAGPAFTNVFQQRLPPGRFDRIGKATICLDPTQRWEIGVDGDPDTYNVRYVATHEIGHALGLDHLGRAGGIMGFAYLERIRGTADVRLAPADRLAIVRLYGAPAGSTPGGGNVAAVAAAAAKLAPGGIAGPGRVPCAGGDAAPGDSGVAAVACRLTPAAR